jgi:aldose 1-epimerase
MAAVAATAACTTTTSSDNNGAPGPSSTTKTTATSAAPGPAAAPTISSEPFGQFDGNAVQRFTLANGHGVKVRILNYGGIIQSLEAPDRNGDSANVVLGFATLDQYVAHNSPLGSGPYFGALVGRYANRIAKGTFTLNGANYQVPVNNNGNSLHGGTDGFDHKVWTATTQQDDKSAALKLQYVSPAGEMGFPGTLAATVTYILDNDNKLTVRYQATTDAPTVLNLTNHSYWNLAGEGSGDVYTQKLTLNADDYTPTDPTQIPTGQIVPVKGTPMDFTQPTAIGARINDPDPQLMIGQGYDLNWVINRPSFNDNSLVQAAKAADPASGRTLTVFTTQPGIQFYSGNFLNGTLVGTGNKTYRQSGGFALETQHFPDSPNHPTFPSTVLNPGQSYDETTVYQLGAE